MPILQIPQAKLVAQPLALAINHDRPNQHLEDRVQACLTQAMHLINPRAVYDLFTVNSQGPGWVEVSNQGGRFARLKVGPKAAMLRQAEMVLIGVTTIGADLEREVKRLNQQGDLYDGYVLDCVGIALLSEAGKALDRLAEEYAAEHGWGLSYRISPGSIEGWEIEEQKILTRLLPLEQIEVALSEQNVFRPFKSASGLVGMGPKYFDKQVRTLCHLCRNQAGCWTRGRSFLAES